MDINEYKLAGYIEEGVRTLPFIDGEARKFYFEDLEKRMRESAETLSVSTLVENISYLNELRKYAMDLAQSLLPLLKNCDDIETKEERFVCHALKGCNLRFYPTSYLLQLKL